MGALLGRDDGCVRDKRVVDTGVGHKVGLELVQINVERTVESQRGCDGADNLGNQTVEVLVVGPGDIQAATADVVDRLVVDEEGTIRVLDGAVGREDGVVGLDDGRGDARSRVNGEFKLALLAVVGGEALEEESTETGTCSTTERVEDEETLERRAVIWRSSVCVVMPREYGLRTSNTADLVDHAVDHLLADGVVTTSICFCQLCVSTLGYLSTHSCWQHPPCR